jgi:hypothetical protein
MWYQLCGTTNAVTSFNGIIAKQQNSILLYVYLHHHTFLQILFCGFLQENRNKLLLIRQTYPSNVLVSRNAVRTTFAFRNGLMLR